MVTIRTEILGTKNIPVRFQVSGTPASGYEYRGLEYAPETVLVKGEASVLNSISAINIPADVINIEGANKDVETSIEIMPYLQELGIALVDENTNKIAVKAIIERKATKIFNYQTKDIKITGLPSNFEVTFSADTVAVNVRALEEDLDVLEENNIEAILDITDLEPGTYTRQLTITLPGEKYELVSQVNVQITITDQDAAVEEDAANADEDQSTGSGSLNNDTNTEEDEDDSQEADRSQRDE